MRTKGLAIYITFNNLGNAFNQFVNPIALDAISWKYYILYIALDLVVAGVAYLQFPETRSLTIEEISCMFDYGVRDGRAKVLEMMEARGVHGDGTGKRSGGETDERKPSAEHVEEARGVQEPRQ